MLDSVSLSGVVAEFNPTFVPLAGFVIGFVFGFVLQRTNFCPFGSISDAVLLGDFRRARAWLLAALTCLCLTQLAFYHGYVDLRLSMYLTPNTDWFVQILGGLLFGVGMALAGGCVSKNIVRFAGGDCRSGVVLVVTSLMTYLTISGVLAPLRHWLQEATELSLDAKSQSMPDLLELLGVGDVLVRTFSLVGIIAVVLLYIIFKEPAFRKSHKHIFGGVLIGSCVAFGWIVTGIAYDEFSHDPVMPISLSFVRPVGDGFEYLRRYTGEGLPSFGVASVLGTFSGACLANLFGRNFHVTGFADSNDTLRNLLGASLMGVGGVLAMGCTIGQGLTGVAALSVGSLLSLFAIIVGALLALRWLEKRII